MLLKSMEGIMGKLACKFGGCQFCPRADVFVCSSCAEVVLSFDEVSRRSNPQFLPLCAAGTALAVITAILAWSFVALVFGPLWTIRFG